MTAAAGRVPGNPDAPPVWRWKCTGIHFHIKYVAEGSTLWKSRRRAIALSPRSLPIMLQLVAPLVGWRRILLRRDPWTTS